jgi:hypothetical protein
MFNPFVTTFVNFPLVVGAYTYTPMAPQTAFWTLGIVLGLLLSFTWLEGGGGGQRLTASTLAPRETYVAKIQSSKTSV